MQVLRILVAMVLLLNVLLSSAQQDTTVSKVFPANIVCRRNSTQRGVERQEIMTQGGSENLLVLLLYAIYLTIISYTVLHNPSCTINPNHFLNR